MSEQSVVIEQETIDLIYKMAGINKPETIDNEAIKLALEEIQTKLIGTSSDSLSQFENNEVQEEYHDEQWQKDLRMAGLGEKRKILVVDDIGVVTYQLKILFQKIGFEVDTAKDIYSAAQLIKKIVYDFIVMDLFVSTEREGFLLLDETKKIIMTNNLKTKIIVITASTKGEHKVKCLNRGANKFLEKDTGWQEELVKYVDSN